MCVRVCVCVALCVWCRPQPEGQPDVFDVNAPEWELKRSPLHMAVSLGHAAVVAVLLQHGADAKKMFVDEQSKAAVAPMTMLARLAKNDAATAESILLMLLRAGATCQQVRRGRCGGGGGSHCGDCDGVRWCGLQLAPNQQNVLHAVIGAVSESVGACCHCFCWCVHGVFCGAHDGDGRRRRRYR